VTGVYKHGACMEAVEDVQGLGAFLADDLQIGLPHVRTDEHDLGDDFRAQNPASSGQDIPCQPQHR